MTVKAPQYHSVGRSTDDSAIALWAIFSVITIACALASLGVPGHLSGVLLVSFSTLIVGVLVCVGRLTAATVALLYAGALQPVVASIVPSTSTLLLDDAPLLALGVTTAVLLLRRAWWRPTLLMVIVVGFIGVAILHSPDRSVGVYQAREIMVPLILIGIGAYLARTRPKFLGSLARSAIYLGWASVFYMAIEFLMGPVISPLRQLGLNTSVADSTLNGLPANYYYFTGVTNHALLRLGGFLMNPPVTGIFTASLALVIYRIRSLRISDFHRIVLTVALGLCTIGTLARSGLVILGIGFGLPFLVRRLPSVIALVLAAVPAYFVGTHFAGSGASIRHVDGLAHGFILGISHPFGMGFGVIGNAAKVAGQADEGESLLGILMASLGWPGIALCGIVFVLVGRCLNRIPWLGSMGLGALVCAALSESAASLSGAVTIWIVTGAALVAIDQAKEPTKFTADADREVFEDLPAKRLARTQVGEPNFGAK